jgi:hypothetical protein
MKCHARRAARLLLGMSLLGTYADEASFLMAIGPDFIRADFDAFASGTVITTQVPGVAFSSPHASHADYFPIQAFASPGAVSPPNTLAGGFVSGLPELDQTMVLDFAPDIVAFGFFLSPLTPNSNVIEVKAEFRDGLIRTFAISDADSSGTEFLGLISDTRIFRITLRSTRGEGQQGFRQFGIDNVTFKAADTTPPTCTAVKAIVDGVLGFNGTSTDSAPFDSGVASIELVGGTNVSLTCDPPFPAACGSVATPAPSATWRVAPADPGLSGSGVVVTTDASGNTCEFGVTFLAFAGGAADKLEVCRADGVVLFATNTGTAPPGPIACSATLPGPAYPPFPPGYEPSPAGDPAPCVVFTIRSPITGPTGMALNKDGEFEPRLRLLFSRFDGTAFGPFADITETLEEITTISPDPTRPIGSGVWSQVLVACGVLAELCNGLDDDGDGSVDEGLPVGGPAIDCDGDGFPLCPTTDTSAVNCAGETVPLDPGAPSDCNDQIGSIHPGADEKCNGLDDDCDGAVDEGAPAGGQACTIPGRLGVCNAGTTSCAEGPMTCVQTTLPTEEVCDGLDNDCDGEVDEGHPGGGAACTLTDLQGPCAQGVLSCAEGPATCVQTVFPAAETCEGVDNDCDGSVDEDLGTTTCGSGACARTIDNCAAGVPQTCVPAEPGPEVCNGVDDDCDGSIDEVLVFSGYLQPVNADGSSIFQQKSTIPIRFRLSDCAGGTPPPVTATLEVIFHSNRISGTVEEVVTIANQPTTGSLYIYDARTNQYHYNLGTKGLRPNATYLLRTRIEADGSVHDVLISLK